MPLSIVTNCSITHTGSRWENLLFISLCIGISVHSHVFDKKQKLYHARTPGSSAVRTKRERGAFAKGYDNTNVHNLAVLYGRKQRE